jgi:hypothetical protein
MCLMGRKEDSRLFEGGEYKGYCTRPYSGYSPVLAIHPFGFKIFTNIYNGAGDEVVPAGNNF